MRLVRARRWRGKKSRLTPVSSFVRRFSERKMYVSKEKQKQHYVFLFFLSPTVFNTYFETMDGHLKLFRLIKRIMSFVNIFAANDGYRE